VEYVCKPGALAALVGVAVLVDPTIPARRGWFVGALVFSLVGDVLLMLPRDLFVAGLASFLVGHVAYVIGLTRHGGTLGATLASAAVVAVIGAVIGRRILGAVRATAPPMTGPVGAYMVVISIMVATAGASGNVLAAGGAALFYVSDASIAWDRFVRPWSWARTWIMVTYHLGQAGLVLSLVR
jgi:uncharacterized membrane protein YhhN